MRKLLFLLVCVALCLPGRIAGAEAAAAEPSAAELAAEQTANDAELVLASKNSVMGIYTGEDADQRYAGDLIGTRQWIAMLEEFEKKPNLTDMQKQEAATLLVNFRENEKKQVRLSHATELYKEALDGLFGMVRKDDAATTSVDALNARIAELAGKFSDTMAEILTLGFRAELHQDYQRVYNGKLEELRGRLETAERAARAAEGAPSEPSSPTSPRASAASSSASASSAGGLSDAEVERLCDEYRAHVDECLKPENAPDIQTIEQLDKLHKRELALRHHLLSIISSEKAAGCTDYKALEIMVWWSKGERKIKAAREESPIPPSSPVASPSTASSGSRAETPASARSVVRARPTAAASSRRAAEAPLRVAAAPGRATTAAAMPALAVPAAPVGKLTIEERGKVESLKKQIATSRDATATKAYQAQSDLILAKAGMAISGEEAVADKLTSDERAAIKSRKERISASKDTTAQGAYLKQIYDIITAAKKRK